VTDANVTFDHFVQVVDSPPQFQPSPVPTAPPTAGVGQLSLNAAKEAPFSQSSYFIPVVVCIVVGILVASGLYYRWSKSSDKGMDQSRPSRDQWDDQSQSQSQSQFQGQQQDDYGEENPQYGMEMGTMGPGGFSQPPPNSDHRDMGDIYNGDIEGEYTDRLSQQRLSLHQQQSPMHDMNLGSGQPYNMPQQGFMFNPLIGAAAGMGMGMGMGMAAGNPQPQDSSPYSRRDSIPTALDLDARRSSIPGIAAVAANPLNRTLPTKAPRRLSASTAAASNTRMATEALFDRIHDMQDRMSADIAKLQADHRLSLGAKDETL